MTGWNNVRKGQGYGRVGREGCGGSGRKGQGGGYSSQGKPKSTKVGLCKELESHIFDYGGHDAAKTMRVTQEKIQQYVGLKFGEDIYNELKTRILVVLTPPKYSYAIELRHAEYKKLVRKKQTNLMTDLQSKLI